MSRVCEAFHCLPSEAVREYRRLELGAIEEILEARAYEQAKALYDAADTADAQKRLPRSELMDLVKVLEFETAQKDIDDVTDAQKEGTDQ